MRHQRRVIAVHRAWRVEQHCQQILPDIPNPRCVLLQAVHDETDVLTVQLQQLRPHDLGRVVIACNADSAAGAANRLLHQIDDLVKLLAVNVTDRLPERRSRCSPESIPDSFQTFLSLPFASARERPENRKGKELNR